jgi:guanine nucleotide-binding protein subunit beta-2-like 1 protein
MNSEESIKSKFMGFLKGHSDQVTSIVSGSTNSEGKDSTILVSGSRDKTLIMWSLEGRNEETNQFGKPLKSMTGHNHFVTDLAITNGNSHLISSSWDKTMRLWNLRTCETQELYQSNNKEINTVCFSKDNRYIYSGGCESQMMLWNTKGQKKADSTQENHQDWVSRIRFSPSAKHPFYASAGWDGRLKIWNGHFRHNGYIQAHDSPIYALAIANNGTFIATGGKDGKVKLFNISESPSPRAEFSCGSIVNDLAFNPMFRMVAAATDNSIRIWDITNLDGDEVFCTIAPRDENASDDDLEDDDEDEDEEEEEVTTKKTNVRFTSLAWSSTGKFVYAGCSDGNIQVFNIDHSA